MITDSKNSSIAKLLATENITVVNDLVPTAMFDVKNRILTLPIWADLTPAVKSLLVGHEVGHALYTPEEGWHDAVCSRGGNYKSFLNVVEDARIEKLVQRKYPGLRRDFVSGYKSLMAQGFFGSKDATDFGLIDRINTHFKCGMTANIPFADDEVQWVDRISKLETWEQVVKVTDELFDFCKQQEEQKKQEEQQREDEAESEEGEDESEDYSDGHGSSMGDDDFDEDYDDESEGDESDDAEEGESGSTHGSSDEETDSSDEGEEGSSDDGEESDDTSATSEESGEDGSDEENDEDFGNHGGTEGGQSQDEDGPRSETDDALRESIEREFAGDASRIEVVNIEVRADDHEQYFVGYKEVLEIIKNELAEYEYLKDTIVEGEKEYDEWYQSARRSISLMVKDFEMKKSATRLSRTRISRSGSLDTLKMNNYRCTDDIFKKIKNTPKGKNHGFVMVLDLSGSMCDVLGDVVKQTMLLTHFCRRINVPFRVYGFTDYLCHYADGSKREDYTDLNVAQPDARLRMIEIFNEKMSKSDMLYMCKALTGSSCGRYRGRLRPFSLGGTPLDSSIVALIPKIQEFQKAHRLDIMNTIFLTDGASHTVEYVHERSPAADGDYYTHKRALNDHVGLCRNRETYATIRYGNKVYDLGKYSTATGALMDALKDATGTSILGYYVFSGKGKSSAMQVQRRFGVASELRVENWKKFKKGFHVTVEEEGYDEMYLVWQKNMRVTDSTMEVDSGANKGALKRAFAKTSSNSKQARALLQDIVKRVA